jgi:hypothetical protein
MNEVIKSMAEFFESKNIKATKMEVFSFIVISLKETYGMSNKDAINLVFGENRYEAMIDQLYKQFTEAV